MTEITIKKHLKPFLLSIAFLLAACTGNRQKTIADTDRMLEEDPQQALTVLDSLERLDNLSLKSSFLKKAYEKVSKNNCNGIGNNVGNWLLQNAYAWSW